MEGLSRQEYPAILDRLPPAAAVIKFNERVKRIGKVNSEIADWLAERRKVEDLYVQGLKKLARKPLQEVGGDLGVFEAPWRKILASTEEIAKSHGIFSDRIEKDVEQPLRNFATTNKEMSAIPTIQGNLTSMAKELEDALEKSDKLAKKGGKANSLKLEVLNTRLATANSQWDAQAPFIFETLQALDERRLNHLRDVLTQYETHEAEQVDRSQKTIESTLGLLLEIDTTLEIIHWATSSTVGKQVIERKGRQLSTAGSSTTGGPPQPPTPRSTFTDDKSEHSTKQESGESKLRSRFGTMMGKRRQSIHGGFGRAPSPSKGGFVPFGGRNTASRDGRPSPSPQASSNNLRGSPTPDNRLSSLAESPTAMSPTSQTNGTKADSSLISDSMHEGSATTANGTAAAAYADVTDVPPPPGPPPSHMKAVPEVQTDSEGFTVPAAMTDPISQAQLDAADGDQPQFKLDIRKEPIPEQDADAQAALYSVANTLRSSQLTPNRKAGTVRGRRDVRNTVYVPSGNSLDASHLDNVIPPSPGIPAGRAAALAALTTGDHAAPPASDTTSIRSGHSLTAHTAVKHLDMHQPGLNVSIVETMSATLENGVVTTAKINGEIALVHNKTEDDLFPSTSEVIRINDYPNLEVIGPNRTFIHPASPEKPDEFTIDLAPISSKTSVAFTYRVHVDESIMPRQGPLLLKAAWKPQDDKLGLVLEYSLNPACGVESLSFSNLVLVAMYQGTRGSACQTKPTGTHIKEKSLVYWRLGDVTLESKAHKIVARIIGTDGVAPEPGHIEARWELTGSSASSIGSGITISRLDLGKGKEKEASDNPFADENLPVTPVGSWVDVETHKKFVSGKYEAR